MLAWLPIFSIWPAIIRSNFLNRTIYFIYFIEGFVNLSHIIITGGPLTASSLFVLLNTNASEAGEFFALKLSLQMLLVIPYFALYLYSWRLKPTATFSFRNGFQVIILLFSLIFISENFIHDRLIRKGIPSSAKVMFSLMDEMTAYQNLKHRKINDVNVKSDDNSPSIVVLVIGESCSRRHMSLYGYNRNTNPKLSRRDDIIAFSDVVSPYSHTLNAVLTLLTETNMDNRKPYDSAISLLDVFHSAGYQNWWISNQSPIGVWDNGIFNLAETADKVKFVNKSASSSFESLGTGSYDEQVLQPFTDCISTPGKKFIIIHLMGSHSFYSKRYPSQYAIFNKGQDKTGETIDEYDNSVLYNDMILDSILQILKQTNKESVCVMLSDHGENVYDELGKAGHDYAGSVPSVNVEVPFVLWASEAYKAKNNQIWNDALSNKNKPFMTDDLFHALIHLGKMKTNLLDSSRSIFSGGFNDKRERILEDGKPYQLSSTR